MRFFSKKEDVVVKEKLKETIVLSVTMTEKEWVMNQAQQEFSSMNSIIRKAIKHYKDYKDTNKVQ